jgi:hypothetical protein
LCYISAHHVFLGLTRVTAHCEQYNVTNVVVVDDDDDKDDDDDSDDVYVCIDNELLN